MTRTIMKRTVPVLLALFFVFVSYAQAPGYMGKKTVVGYGFNFNPALGSLAMGYSDSPVNMQHELFLEHTVGQKFSLGLSARIYRYRYNNTEPVSVDPPANVNFRQLDENPLGTYVIRGRNYQFYGKFYKHGYIAPWGKYFVMGLVIVNYRTDYNPDEMYVTVQRQLAPSSSVYQTMNMEDFGPTTQYFFQSDFFFGNGNSRIFSNKIVLDYGYTINVVAMSRIFLTALETFEEKKPDKYIEATSTPRVAAINRFNFFVKLGYLF